MLFDCRKKGGCQMSSLIKILLVLTSAVLIVTSCKSEQEKEQERENLNIETVKEIVSAFISKQMKNPESFKIVSIEVRKDTIPFYLTKEMLKMTDEVNDALKKFSYYKDMSYLFAKEKYESAMKAKEAQEVLKNAYKLAQENDTIEVEYVAYVKSSGTNPMGGTVSSSHIIITDLKDPTKILGDFVVDDDFIKQFYTIKTIGEEYEFKTNKFGKYEIDDLPYFERFIMNDAN